IHHQDGTISIQDSKAALSSKLYPVGGFGYDVSLTIPETAVSVEAIGADVNWGFLTSRVWDVVRMPEGTGLSLVPAKEQRSTSVRSEMRTESSRGKARSILPKFLMVLATASAGLGAGNLSAQIIRPIGRISGEPGQSTIQNPVPDRGQRPGEGRIATRPVVISNAFDIVRVWLDAAGKVFAQDRAGTVWPVDSALSAREYSVYGGGTAVTGIPMELFKGQDFSSGREVTLTVGVPIDPTNRVRESNLPAFFIIHHADGRISIQDSRARVSVWGLGQGLYWYDISLTLPPDAVRVEGIGANKGVLTSRIWDVVRTPLGNRLLVPSNDQRSVSLIPKTAEIRNHLNAITSVNVDEHGNVSVPLPYSYGGTMPVDDEHAFSLSEIPVYGGETVLTGIPRGLFDGKDFSSGQEITVAFPVPINTTNRVQDGNVPAFFVIRLADGRVTIQDSKAGLSMAFFGWGYPYKVSLSLPTGPNGAVSVEGIGYSNGHLTSMIWDVVHTSTGQVLLVPADDQRSSRWGPLSTGWTFAASNANYAFQTLFTNPGNPMAGNEVLSVHDLRIGKTWKAYDKSAAQEDLWDSPHFDVSPDGKYMVFATRITGGGSKAYVYALNAALDVNARTLEFVLDTGRAVPKPGGAYHFYENEILIDMVDANTLLPVGVYHIDTTTWQGTFEPVVPEGGAYAVPTRSEVRQSTADRSQLIAHTVAVVRQLGPQIAEVRKARLGFRPKDLRKIEKMVEGTGVNAELLVKVLVAALAGGIASPEITAGQMAEVLTVLAKAQVTPLPVLVQQVRGILNVQDEEGLLIRFMAPGTAIGEANLVALANTKQHMIIVWMADAQDKAYLKSQATKMGADLLENRFAKNLAIKDRFNIAVVDQADPMAGVNKIIEQKKAQMRAISRGLLRYVFMGDFDSLNRLGDTVQGLMIDQPVGKDELEEVAALTLGARVSQEILKVTEAEEIEDAVARMLERQGAKGFYSFKSDVLNAVLAVAMQALRAIRSAA
ncbi:MAG: hypothetical protein ABH891_09110, partial [Candidatus Omnitrophota bacterium]